MEKFHFFMKSLMQILVAIQLFKFRSLVWLPRPMCANHQDYLFFEQRRWFSPVNCFWSKKKYTYYCVSLDRNTC